MKSARDEMDIMDAYRSVGTYRGAAVLCGTTPKTVKRVVERQAQGQEGRRAAHAPKTAVVADLITERLQQTDGRISAKRLLPLAQAAGFRGSLRTFQRAVKSAKAAWKTKRRNYRPWVPAPGGHLVIDWASEAGWEVFCAVLAWSRVRFVRFARDQRQETTLRLLAECFEVLGGVPSVVLTDRMACLRAGVVANVVVPHPAYVRFAAQFGFRPDFCEAADPESKGVVEHLAGYVQRDLLVPSLLTGGWDDLVSANTAAVTWCGEVNGRVHSETAAIPAERLLVERTVLRPLPSLRPPLRTGQMRKVDRLGMVRFGSGRYAVAQELVGKLVEVRADEGTVVLLFQSKEVARHVPVGPGEVALGAFATQHRQPTRAVRPRSDAEVRFLSLGPVAETFLRAAAAAGTLRLETELAQIVAMEASWGKPALLKALERAVRFRRFKARDVGAILRAGSGAPTPTTPGTQLTLSLPSVPERSLEAYALAGLGVRS